MVVMVFCHDVGLAVTVPSRADGYRANRKLACHADDGLRLVCGDLIDAVNGAFSSVIIEDV